MGLFSSIKLVAKGAVAVPFYALALTLIVDFSTGENSVLKEELLKTSSEIEVQALQEELSKKFRVQFSNIKSLYANQFLAKIDSQLSK